MLANLPSNAIASPDFGMLFPLSTLNYTSLQSNQQFITTYGAISLKTLIQVILVHIILFAPVIIAVIFLPPLILAN